jgi:hypothetical protein
MGNDQHARRERAMASGIYSTRTMRPVSAAPPSEDTRQK